MTLSPTLSRLSTVGALALAIAASPAYAVAVKDDLVSVGIKGQLQVRANLLNDVNNTAGDSIEYDSAIFSARRARFGLSAQMGDNWKANLIVRGGETVGLVAPGIADPISLFYANVYYTGKTGSVAHEVGMGLDKPFTSASSQSSTSYLLPTERITSAGSTAGNFDPRGYGVFYKLTGDFFAAGVSLMNGENAVNADGTADGITDGTAVANGQDKFTYTLRAEFAPGAGLWAKKMETYAGADGHSLVIGAEYVNNMGNDLDEDTSWIGIDVTGHLNGLSALAEIKMLENEQPVGDSVKGQYIAIQAGYAFKLNSGYVVEPALRYSLIDNNTDTDEISSYGTVSENGGSGTQIDIGANWYWKGHNNKTQLALQLWSAEEGDADATVLRLQQNFAF